MELQALSEALMAFDPGVQLEVLSDSQYVVDIFTEWLPRWRANGMRTSSGKPVSNEDLITRIAQQLQGRSVTLTWVRGHGGHPLHDRADELAVAATGGGLVAAVERAPKGRHWDPALGLPGSDDRTGASDRLWDSARITDPEALAARLMSVYGITVGTVRGGEEG
jgi:hypothetical protein